ncbi:unnamed protein product [Paramecium octaurelia]|uniref:Uncharacterized protein n=1 Tax=Paramecium octaurelia TaxID=43137 RepID=A0A8S1UQ55_PAROT|nr:unnamed protein product [Paramecium octaurelia]
MRIQATSFRLPALKLQPKDSYQCLSYGDNNLSNSSMIKYQSSPLRNYDPSPIKKRVRGMTIAIYNSQEKLKTADYRNGGEFITQIQQNNQSTSVVNTFRRYRSKLKQLMQPAKDEGVNSRDPRLFSFKDPGATIRLDRLNNDRKDQQIQEKVTQLMGKVRLLFSSRQCYQEPLHQDTFQVTLVKLKDEYDCLYQDFNDYYVQNNKLDKQVLQLLNHMEIIETLLKPKQPIKIKKYQPQQPNIIQPEYQSPIVEAQEIVEETPQQSIIVDNLQSSPQQPNQLSIHEQREQSVFTPLTSKQYNDDQSISDLENDQSNKANMQKKKKQKSKKSPLKSQKTIAVQESILDLNALEDYTQVPQSISSQTKIIQRSTPQSNKTRPIQYEDTPETPQNIEEENSTQFEKPGLKRTVSNLGSMSKKRNTVLESKEGLKKKQKKTGTISEQDDSEQEEEKQNNTQIESQNDSNDEQQQQQQNRITSLDFSFLDMLIASQNIYKHPFYQNWEYHTDEIIKGTCFGEYDL